MSGALWARLEVGIFTDAIKKGAELALSFCLYVGVSVFKQEVSYTAICT